MARSSAISKLLAGLQRAPHDYTVPTSIFPSLSVDRIAADLRLTEKGAERGKENEPPSASAAFDDVENLIIERIETEKRAVSASYHDQIQTYDGRRDSLHFEERFSEIRQLAPQAVADFRVEAAQGRDELHLLRRTLVEAERDRDAFRERHGIKRAAKVSSNNSKALSFAILAALFVGETVVNGAFLSKANEQGLLGGVVQAVSFALLNVLVSFAIGLGVVSMINHRNVLMKLVGLVGLAGYLGFAVYLNLAMAHTRELSGHFIVDSGVEVMRRLIEAPLSISDVTSWIFFAVGPTFSVFAMLKGLTLNDTYPGYSAVETARLQAQARYTTRKSDLIDNLREIRDEVSEGMKDIGRDLSVKRGEFDSILQARARLNAAFTDFQSQLERAAISLLSIYREANRRARSDQQPERFSYPFSLDRSPIVADTVSETAGADLRKSIAESQEMLSAQAESVNAEFEAAVARYHQIDDIIPEAGNGATQKG